MKNITVKDQEHQLEKYDITSLEQKLGTELPTDYKNYLLTHNGGKPEKNCFWFAEVEEASDVDWFCAYYDGEYDNLLKEVWRFDDRIPKEFIPIARDSGGNRICLGIKNLFYNKVYFWDHEEEAYEGETPTTDNMYLIANSFTDFINGLYRLDLRRDYDNQRICVRIHDQYSLSFSYEVRQYGGAVTDFFAQAPISTEDFVIERPDKTDDITLYYDDKIKGIRFKRVIKPDSSFEDSEEALNKYK